MRYIVEEGWRFEEWYVYDTFRQTYVRGPYRSYGEADRSCDLINALGLEGVNV